MGYALSVVLLFDQMHVSMQLLLSNFHWQLSHCLIMQEVQFSIHTFAHVSAS